MNKSWVQLKAYIETNIYVKKTKQKQTADNRQTPRPHLNFNWKVVGPFNINDIFQNKLILIMERKKNINKQYLK